VLIVVFGSIVAAVLPIVMALFATACVIGLGLIGQLVEFNLFVTNMVTMIGLAVGIDYSLFIVSRYREERKKGFPKLGAIARSGATANRAVFFSGLTGVLALAGMFILPTTIVRSLATGAILVTSRRSGVDDAARRSSGCSATGSTGRGCPSGRASTAPTTPAAASGTGSPAASWPDPSCSLWAAYWSSASWARSTSSSTGARRRTSASSRTTSNRSRPSSPSSGSSPAG
jgi:hypothetical protein